MLLGGLNNGAKTSKLTSGEEITLHDLSKDLSCHTFCVRKRNYKCKCNKISRKNIQVHVLSALIFHLSLVNPDSRFLTPQDGFELEQAVSKSAHIKIQMFVQQAMLQNSYCHW